jgi:hypothetical protein
MKTFHRSSTYLALTLWLSLFSGQVFAQRGYTALTYSPSLAIGTTADYIDQPAWRGGGLEAGFFVTRNFSLGISGNWHVFYENIGVNTFEVSETTLISGNEFRYLNTFPLFAKANLYLGDTDSFYPYVSFGAGTIHRRQDQIVGGFRFSDRSWQLGLFPEVGIGFRLNWSTHFLLNARYNYGFGTDQTPNTSYLNLNAGFTFLY